MIEYFKGAYGLNLLVRAHGSVLCKAVIPGLFSVIVFLVIDKWLNNHNDALLGDPDAVGILIASVSFIIVFRANNGYQRYWEACGAVHEMMSKWLDATVLTSAFHMQCSHYDSIKPPSYFDHPELNKLNLTRDRDLDQCPSRSILQRRKVEKSINYVQNKKKRNQIANNKHDGADHVSSRSSEEYQHLLGPGQPDGGWGLLFPEGINGKTTATFYWPPKISVRGKLSTMDMRGFASTAGGRTPSLFLQELAHLSSLCCAVALATLRNDIEGSESPLGTYIPGAPWPEADPDKLPPLDRQEFLPKRMLLRNLYYWFGMDRTPEARTKHNATRPLPVIGGVSENEIAFLQRAKGPSAKTTLAWSWLSEFVTREHLSGSTGKVGSPIISRLHQFLSEGMVFYNHARKIMYIPFPFPHAQLSAFFILIVIFAVPLVTNQYTNKIWLGSIMTFLTVTCLAGLHEVARELENPFRNIPNDIPLCTLQAMYNESLITMFSGYHPDHYWDPSDFIGEGALSEIVEEGGSDSKAVERPGAEGPASSWACTSASSVPQSVENQKTLAELDELASKQSKQLVLTLLREVARSA